MTPLGSRSPSRTAAPSSPKARESRAVRVGVTASALLHLLLLALYPALTGVPAARYPTASDASDEMVDRGIEIVELREVVRDEPEPPVDAPVETPAPGPPFPSPRFPSP
jgi:hypothetical protein